MDTTCTVDWLGCVLFLESVTFWGVADAAPPDYVTEL
jgi:hypothetical protein